jgi:hypothetical protein
MHRPRPRREVPDEKAGHDVLTLLLVHGPVLGWNVELEHIAIVASVLRDPSGRRGLSMRLG